jgi:curved DNA-binding protein
MAMKHHPDRGGDEQKFKEIATAYEALTDPQKRHIIDMGGDPNAQPGRNNPNQGNPFEFHFGTGNMEDIFNNFGFSGFNRNLRKNKSLNISVEITLEEVLTGKDIAAELGLPTGRKKMINIQIPPGIEHGQQIRYEGMGDNAIPNLMPGDLIVNVNVLPHRSFKREGTSLTIDKEINAWDAILGTSIEIKTLGGKSLSVNLPQGTQPDTTFRIPDEGLPDMRTRRRGNLLIKIKVKIPKDLTQAQLEKIQQVQHGI